MKKQERTKLIIKMEAAILCLALIALGLLVFLGIRKGNQLEPEQQYEETQEIQTGGTEDNTQETGERPQLSDTQTQEEIPTIDSDLVFAGSKQWLFYKSTQDGDTMADYYAENDFSEKQMENIAAQLEEQAAQLEEKGAKFVLLIVPNKEVIYDQFMPEDMRRDADVESRTDKLAAYLQEHTDLDVIYVKDKFLSMRDDEKLIYYKTDTHWNMRGCYVAVQKILQNLYGKSKSIEDVEFQEHLYDYAGDLVAKANLGAEYNIDTVYFFGADQVTDEDKVEDSLLLVGDSFAEFMKIEMEYYFNGVVDGNIEKYGYNFYTATSDNLGTNPDVVVWECCERHIARLEQK